MTRQFKEILIKNLFALLAFVAVLVLGLIVVFLFREGLPLFRLVSPGQFLFGTAWYPTYDPPEYGI
ncbi:MAG TPA: phosphate ABC transporter permease subunit PstC, partial [Syntrophales bacterium]|nr:phosphate ABC transporter permease subunit PstC [Syntrophales bacterium]